MLVHAAAADFARPARSALAAWFVAHGRQLGFRGHADPWGVLVSEVMAQQTQISRVEPAWAGFMGSFPTPAALASATPAAVLRAWAGMGYNRRALNLQAASVAIVEQHGGAVPEALEALLALPGVGPYTARAVAAIAFGRPVAAVDTNVRRVVGRLVAGHGSSADGGSPLAPRALQAAADALVDPADPARWTHAVMDVGATICRPVRPRCGACPVAAWCAWFAGAAGASIRAQPRPPVETIASRTGRRAPKAIRFTTTRRWLRGRIVGRLRDLPEGAWMILTGPMGDHGAAAVVGSLDDLVGEGMVERRPDGAVRLPSTRR